MIFSWADLSTIAEREGFLLNDEDILDLLQNAYEDPILPLSYKLVDSYSRFFLENKKKNHIFVTNYDYMFWGYLILIMIFLKILQNIN